MATMAQSPTATGFHDLTPRQVRLTMTGLILALLLGALDQTIVGTALPKVIAELKGFEHYSWVFTAYMVTSTTMVPIFGKLSDMYGRKWFYVSGVTVFLIASWLCGASQNMWELIVFRGLQGVGAGIMQSIAFTIVGDLFPPARRGRVQGLFGSIFGISSVIGPTIGGYITDNLNWRWVFYVNLPVGILALTVLVLFFPYFRPQNIKRSIDYWGVLTLISFVVPMLVAFSLAGNQYSWGSPQIIGLLVAAAIMLGAFLYAEMRAVEPVISLSLFRRSIFSVSTIVVFLTGAGMFGSILYIPLFVQGVSGESATSSGTILIPLMLGLVFASIISGQLISRTGRYKLLGILGTAAMAVGMYLLSGMGVSTDNAIVVRNMIILGVGLGTTMPIFTLAVQNSVPYNLMGVATSSVQFFRSIGGTIGVAIMGSLLASRFQDKLLSSIPKPLQNGPALSKLQGFDNPQALLNPQAMAAMHKEFAAFGPQGDALFQQFVHVIRVALASAISSVFLLGTVAVVISFVAVFFLKEIPLRKTNVPTGEQRGKELATEGIPNAGVLPPESQPSNVSR